MRQETFLKSKFSFLLEIAIGLLQSFFSFLGILWLILLFERLKNSPSKFKITWASALCYYIATLHWISFALWVEIDKFWWAIPLALVILPAYTALFPALASLWFDRKSPYLFCLSFVALEWTRGWIFTGFPWGFMGHLWLDTHVIQLAAWGGVFPLSFLMIALAARLKSAIIICILTLPLIFLGYENTFFDTKVRLVQPHVTQKDKWDYSKQDQRFFDLISLSTTTDPKVKAIILPETAFTFFFEDFPERVHLIQSAIPKGGYFIAGSVRKDLKPFYGFNLRSSLLALDDQAETVDFYDKTHLVPFGEYVPLNIRHFLPYLAKITHGTRDYTPGIGPRKIALKNFPSFNPVLCYESIFPSEIATNNRADFILIATNDAWFDGSIGPQQHLDLARIRAIEQGLGVVRVANTGISAIIDPKGKVLESIPLGQKGAIDTFIPKPLEQTLYSQYIYLENYFMYAVWIFLIFMHLRRRHK